MTQTEGVVPPVHIRPLCATDRAGWAKLWAEYLAFYETELPQDIYDVNFARLTDAARSNMFGFVAEHEGKLVGLVHVIVHEHGWKNGPVFYLQDLYAAPDARGMGVGRALIEAVYAEQDRQGAEGTYWLTQEFNQTARKLYDRVAQLTPFIKYQRA